MFSYGLLTTMVLMLRFYYSNLEDKVLIGDGGIFMNESVPVLAKQPNNRLNDCIWDPS